MVGVVILATTLILVTVIDLFSSILLLTFNYNSQNLRDFIF
jgi:hypothetical protein